MKYTLQETTAEQLTNWLTRQISRRYDGCKNLKDLEKIGKDGLNSVVSALGNTYNGTQGLDFSDAKSFLNRFKSKFKSTDDEAKTAFLVTDTIGKLTNKLGASAKDLKKFFFESRIRESRGRRIYEKCFVQNMMDELDLQGDVSAILAAVEGTGEKDMSVTDARKIAKAERENKENNFMKMSRRMREEEHESTGKVFKIEVNGRPAVTLTFDPALGVLDANEIGDPITLPNETKPLVKALNEMIGDLEVDEAMNPNDIWWMPFADAIEATAVPSIENERDLAIFAHNYVVALQANNITFGTEVTGDGTYEDVVEVEYTLNGQPVAKSELSSYIG